MTQEAQWAPSQAASTRERDASWASSWPCRNRTPAVEAVIAVCCSSDYLWLLNEAHDCRRLGEVRSGETPTSRLAPTSEAILSWRAQEGDCVRGLHHTGCSLSNVPKFPGCLFPRKAGGAVYIPSLNVRLRSSQSLEYSSCRCRNAPWR